MFGLIVMTKRERSVHLHGQSLWLLSNLNVLADYLLINTTNAGNTPDTPCEVI